jgi:hypothetical protein
MARTILECKIVLRAAIIPKGKALRAKLDCQPTGLDEPMAFSHVGIANWH